MDSLFLTVLNRAVAAGWLILAVILLRLLLRRAPKKYRVLLWGLAALRLLLPEKLTLKSPVSLVPSAQTLRPEMVYSPSPVITSGIPAVNQAVNPTLSTSLAPAVGDSVNPLQVWLHVGAVVWLMGLAALLLYALFSTLRLRRQVAEAVPPEGNIRVCPGLSTPFVLGLFRPVIYLPSGLDDATRELVLAHEQGHLARRDHWIKPFGFLLLAVFWFSPLSWLAYWLFCRDLELACDELVLQLRGGERKKDYARALVDCASEERHIAACPLAFGEGSVKGRVKNVLRYRKPVLWIGGAAVLLTALLALLFLTNPARDDRPAPLLVEEESFFSDFVVEENRVYFLCRLTIRNPQDEPVYAQITGDFSADREGGLVLGRESAAFRLEEETAAAFFSLSPEEKEAALSFEARLFPLEPGDNTFWAVFWDLHGEASVKQDRLLPPIRFTALVDVTPEAVSEAMDCRIVKNPDTCLTFLLDGEETCVLSGSGSYGFTSAVPWDYDGNGTPDLLYTLSGGSGRRFSLLLLLDRTTREEQKLFVLYPNMGVEGSDLILELETDERGASSYSVYTADVTVNGYDYSDLRFTKQKKAGVVGLVLTQDGNGSGPRFFPDEDFRSLDMPEVTLVPILPPDAPEREGFGCDAEFGGETAWLQGETAEALFGICRDAMELGELISTPSIPSWESSPPLCLAFRVIPSSGAPEDTDFFSYAGTFLVYRGFDDDFALFFPNPYASINAWYRFPAGTYDALMEALTRGGTLSLAP